jgi:hypothetical protein
MPEYYPCPYLGGAIVEITNERYEHVLSSHADFANHYWERAGETIRNPDLAIMRQQDDGAIMPYRWYADIDKNVMVAIRTDPGGRHWVVTAYMTRDVARGEWLWVKS